MFPARARIRTAWSGVERQEAAAPPHVKGVSTGYNVPFVILLYVAKMSTIELSYNTIIVAYLIKSKVKYQLGKELKTVVNRYGLSVIWIIFLYYTLGCW